MISATLYTDPGCPWAYSEIPALRVLQWRYGNQLDWRLVVIGLSESTAAYEQHGYTPARAKLGQLNFRRYGMPLDHAPKERMAATGRACRAIVAARLVAPGTEWHVLRALQLANFTTGFLLDDDDQLTSLLNSVGGIDANAIVSELDSPEVTAAYERDKAEARSADGSPAELQGKTRATDGVVRFTAPSLVLERDGLRLVAGGFQPVEAYDVLVANLDPSLERTPVPDGPGPLLEQFSEGLTTAEVAALLARENDPVDREAAEKALVGLVGEGQAVCVPVGDGALWRLSPTPVP